MISNYKNYLVLFLSFSFIISNSNYYIEYNNGNKLDLQTSVVFRDPTAWYHWCVVWDFTKNLSSERGQI